jgi:hypothetical protein
MKILRAYADQESQSKMIKQEEPVVGLQPLLQDYPQRNLDRVLADHGWGQFRQRLGALLKYNVRSLKLRVQHERDAWKDAWAQWLWFAFGVSAERIGYGRGPLTWMRQLRSQAEPKPLKICLLSLDHAGLPFGPLTAWAINRNSRVCHASLNEGLEQADIIWVYMQDPITQQMRERLETMIERHAKPGAVVVNTPKSYNAFHRPDAFALIEAAGVNVPRSTFSEADVGQTWVVYKTLGQQGGDKVLDIYSGPRDGMAPFEFVDSSRSDGTFARYRAHYLFGKVRPSEVLVADQWNACLKYSVRLEYSFTLTECEIDQIQKIARTLNLQYFAVDFLRRGDGRAVFTDINIYPTIQSPHERVHERGDYGLWHTFDARRRLGLTEPNRETAWDLFDTAMMELVHPAAVEEIPGMRPKQVAARR